MRILVQKERASLGDVGVKSGPGPGRRRWRDSGCEQKSYPRRSEIRGRRT